MKKSTLVKKKIDKDVAPPKRKKILGKRKTGPRKKTSCAKNTFPIIGPKSDNKKSDSTKKLGSEVSNSYNEAGPELDIKSMKETETPKMCNALIGLLCSFPYSSTLFEIANTITFNFSDIYSSVKFKTISSITNSRTAVFKIDPSANNCTCSPALLGLQRWMKLVERQVVYPLQTRIYFFAPVALRRTSLCYYYLKTLCCCLNIILHLDNKVIWAWLKQVWKRRENLNYFLTTEERRYYFLKGTTMF